MLILEGNENNKRNENLRIYTICKMWINWTNVLMGKEVVDLNSRKNYQKDKSGAFYRP